MAFLLEIFQKFISIILSVSFLAVAGYLILAMSERKYLIWIPAILYVPLAFGLYLFGLHYLALLTLVGAFALHVATCNLVTFYRNRKRYRALSSYDIAGLTAFVNDSDIRFFKRAARADIDRRITDYIVQFDAIARHHESPIFDLVAHVVRRYRANALKPASLDVRVTFDFIDLNRLLTHLQKEDYWSAAVSAADAAVSDLEKTQVDEETADRLAKARAHRAEIGNFQAASGKLTKVPDNEPLTLRAERRAEDIVFQMIDRLIPSTFYTRPAREPLAPETGETGIFLHYTPQSHDNQSILFWDKALDQSVAVATGKAFVHPQIDVVHTASQISFGASIKKLDAHFAFVPLPEDHWKATDFSNGGFRRHLLRSMLNFFGASLVSALALHRISLVRERLPVPANENSETLAAKIASDFLGEIKGKSEEKFLGVQHYLSSGALAGIASDEGRHAIERALDQSFQINQDAIIELLNGLELDLHTAIGDALDLSDLFNVDLSLDFS